MPKSLNTNPKKKKKSCNELGSLLDSMLGEVNIFVIFNSLFVEGETKRQKLAYLKNKQIMFSVFTFYFFLVGEGNKQLRVHTSYSIDITMTI